MDGSQTPIWHPISRLSLIASLIDEPLCDCEDQLQNLNPPGREAPILDDALVERIIRVYSEQEEMLPVYEEQLSRWKRETLTQEQQQEISRLETQLNRYRTVLNQILGLAREHAEFTIEKVIERDDAQVGLDVLLGKMDKWL